MELPEKRLSMRGSHQLEVHVLAMEQPLPGNLHDIILTRLSTIGSTRRIYRSHALILPPRTHLGIPGDGHQCGVQPKTLGL
ncbi:hypothetical protein HET69_33480 [Streptomyces sp. CJ_13]|uniref:hypothetical protein n=1 Tax=unclassified Streptomyces TaxID=2593676 RepID=UPI000F436251|nr:MULTISPECIES: hypothetical protein [unclassified Streptomyces]AYV32105.1 hypothetical protein EES41_35720 [Streptomyces sp. ADI95-16]MBT1188766.1 hypothetical protein [Streptomyces sp. CJ_13]